MDKTGKPRSKLILLLVLTFSSYPAWAYKQPTHRDMSKAEVFASDIVLVRELLPDLGLRTSFLERIKNFPNSKNEQKTIVELVADGADFEDRFPHPINHFFDPYHDRGLVYLGVLRGEKSPDWALEDLGDILGPPLGGGDDPNDNAQQDYSYKEARTYMYRALTEPLKLDRDLYFGKLFQALGHILHHVQDMAQPAHVRNDQHLDISERYDLPFENPSSYEEFTNFVHLNSNFHYSGYTLVSLARARDYWTTGTASGKGLADFTNREFVSDGTNFGTKNGADYPAPSINEAEEYFVPDIQTIFENEPHLGQVPPLCDAQNPCGMTFFRMPVEDKLRPELNGIDHRATTRSVYDAPLEKYNKQVTYIDPATGQSVTSNRVFTLNKLNFWSRYPFLIPRATGYGAGLINHFFRGRLEISLPDEGVYALQDHSLAHVRGPDDKATGTTGNVFGFNKLKLKLKNVTPDIVPPGDTAVPQDMFEGELRAVVKYGLNRCYEPDLSGELKFGQADVPLGSIETFSNCSRAGTKYTSSDEYVSVSRPIAVGSGSLPIIPTDVPAKLEFDFSADPIPVNARDVYLQVVYHGKLGPGDAGDPTLVENDAVVVTTRDISEPSYLSIRNWTDVVTDGAFLVDNQLASFSDATDFSLRLNGSTLFKLPVVPGYGYGRVVYLSDYVIIHNALAIWKNANYQTISKPAVFIPTKSQWVRDESGTGSDTFIYQQFWGIRYTYHSKNILLTDADVVGTGIWPLNWDNRETFATLDHSSPVPAVLCFPEPTLCQ